MPVENIFVIHRNAILVNMSPSVLAIDYGLARVGFAYGARQVGLVSERGFWPRDERLHEAIAKLIREQAIDLVIVGLPRSLNGNDTEQTKLSREFAESLKPLGATIELRDEAGTSQIAKERLGANPPKGAIDAEAAAILLQEYFDEI